MSNDNSSINETFELFTSESNKLQELVNQGIKNSENMPLSEIIGTYYQVINVTSLGKFLDQNLKTTNKEDDLISNKIKEVEKFVNEKFNSNLHALIMSKLKNSIETFTMELKNMKKNQSENTKEVVENQAKMYEELRQMMSTKEFVDQYNKELQN